MLFRLRLPFVAVSVVSPAVILLRLILLPAVRSVIPVTSMLFVLVRSLPAFAVSAPAVIIPGNLILLPAVSDAAPVDVISLLLMISCPA